MNKRWRNVGLYVLAVITVIFIGTSVFDKPSTESSTKTLRYSDFIEAVQDKEISRVLISPDNATAQVVENDGSRSCLLYTSPSPRDGLLSRMPSSA